MLAFKVSLVVTTLLCSLLAGFVFAFAVVVMPGIARLGDGPFLRAFQVMDAIIQESQPLFVLVWLGSIVGTITTVAFGVRQLDGPTLLLVIVGAALMLVVVHLPTFAINIPLNNELQRLDVAATDADVLAAARAAFEGRWNRWNNVRTVAAIVASLLLMVVVLRLV